MLFGIFTGPFLSVKYWGLPWLSFGFLRLKAAFFSVFPYLFQVNFGIYCEWKINLNIQFGLEACFKMWESTMWTFVEGNESFPIRFSLCNRTCLLLVRLPFILLYIRSSWKCFRIQSIWMCVNSMPQAFAFLE